ncbi:MAG: Nif3-like dinuclear metal center hexameric protein [Candidatus Mcinerneyibacterium aminivorans]|jgi:dinuclear metal center YbgI/SA1388 family protein|uniref:GTP cyclohydrolase 1 type 2 homolog n=1 Tax=Candidatus Mcinerneyibacterium aminivorans TaxID=2703815 RepID=A0A5D0MJI1_9BACT|nr:MAG: Nif3-like dinuclear metal center hexameric protein [Candidatus Mcinerneyibacterium aminivorans]
MKLKKLDRLLKEKFQIEKIKDPSLNGIQIEGNSQISNIGFAVDVNDKTISMAIENSVDILIVHHGLFWGTEYRIKGIMKKRIKKLLANDITLYAIHLPLDIHTKLGNNRYIFEKLNLEKRQKLVDYEGFPLGFVGILENRISLNNFEKKIDEKLGGINHKIVSGRKVKKVAILSGDPKSLLDKIFEQDFDVLVSGELTHEIYFNIIEKNISAFFVGHYQSEIGGVKLLKEYFENNYNDEIGNTYFFEYDSGL